MEIDAVTIQKTQKQLGKYVKKPALTEKLLNKPPFRFLHDIIKAVIKETGFMSNLFTPDELNYENIKEKEAKIAFLTKLIDAIKSVTDTQLNVKPSKIVAGLEAGETNKLLQAIGKAIDKKADLSNYQTKKSSTKAKKSEQTIKKDAKTIKKSRDSEPKMSSRDSSRNSKDSSRNNKKRDSSRVTTREKVSKPNKEENEPQILANKNDKLDREINEENASAEQNVETVENNEPQFNQVNAEEESANEILPDKSQDVTNLPVEEHTPFIRQPSANLIRPKSAKLKNLNHVDNMKIEQKELNVESDLQALQQNRPKSSLRPPSVRPSSARPGAPRLRPDSALRMNDSVTMGTINVIVENFDNADDEETVVVQSTNDNEEEFINTANDINNKILGDLMNSQENKGQLVEQILEQIQEIDGDERKVQQQIEWEQDTHTKDATAKELNQLRTLIQSLTKTANPLGKLLNYLHEDLDAMHNELQTWTNTRKQLTSEIEKQKKINMDLSKPLVDNLKQIQQEIKKYEQEIVNVKATILKNDLKIKELVSSK